MQEVRANYALKYNALEGPNQNIHCQNIQYST